MQNHSTDFERLQALRREVKEARPKQPAVYVEDLIVGRLVGVEGDLAVAAGLFKELEDDKHSPYLKYGARLSEALDIVQDALYLRNPGLYSSS